MKDCLEESIQELFINFLSLKQIVYINEPQNAVYFISKSIDEAPLMS